MRERILISTMMLIVLIFWQSPGLTLYANGVEHELSPLPPGSSIGKQYLVLIAINNYAHWNPLRYPVGDAGEIRDILTNRYFINEVKELYDANATKKNILTCLSDLRKKLKADDALLVFYSGHGHLDNISQNGYWIPHDGGTDEYNKDRWISNSEIRGLIAQMKTKHVLLLVDCCFSGSLLQVFKDSKPVINNEYFRRAYSHRSRQILTAGSLERVPDQSDFARQLKLALKENKDPYLDGLTLYDKVRRGVPDTLALFGSLKGTDHQEGSSFLFFLKEASREWDEWQKKFKNAVDEAQKYAAGPSINPDEKIKKWRIVLKGYQNNNPFSPEDEQLRNDINQRIEDLIGEVGPGAITLGGKEDDNAYGKAQRANTLPAYLTYINNFPLGSHKAEAYHNIGIIHLDKGEFETAISNLSRAVKLNPEDGDAYNNRGICYKHLKKYEESIKDYTKAIEIYSTLKKKTGGKGAKKLGKKLAAAYNNRGVSYMEKGDKEKAVEDYTGAITHIRQYGDAYFNRGICFLESGDYEKAVEDFEKAARYNKNDAEALEKLALAYEKTGKTNAAEKAREKAKKRKTKKSK